MAGMDDADRDADQDQDGETELPEWVKRARPIDPEALKRANARARASQRDRRQEFARVPLNLIAQLSGPTDRLLLLMVVIAGRRTVKRADGWTPLSKALLQHAGLADRKVRSRAVRHLVAKGWLETRQLGPGMALEYRLSPPVDRPTAH